MIKTYVEKKETVTRKWYLVDAQEQVLGRMATRIAIILMGKHKPIYTPFIDTGDNVIIVNAKKVKVTGRKMEQKNYYNYSGYPGGMKVRSLKRVMSKKPEYIIRHAVRLMLPKNKLGRQMLKKLKIYAGLKHPHEAQQPENLDLNNFQKIEKI